MMIARTVRLALGHAMTSASLARLATTQPLLPLKVLGAIHWQALRLWLKGAAYQPRPHAPAEVSHPAEKSRAGPLKPARRFKPGRAGRTQLK